MSETIPDGFTQHFRNSSVTDPWRPIYSRVGPDCVEIGVMLRPVHCNSRGFVHGGVIATLADNAMGLSLVQAAGQDPRAGSKNISAITVNLTIDYLATANVGQWLQVTPRVQKVGRTMGFTDAAVVADEKTVARAIATFTLVRH